MTQIGFYPGFHIRVV